MYKEFYSFKNIFRRMPQSRRQVVPYLLFNLAYRKFGKATAVLARVGLLGWLGPGGQTALVPRGIGRRLPATPRNFPFDQLADNPTASTD